MHCEQVAQDMSVRHLGKCLALLLTIGVLSCTQVITHGRGMNAI